MAEALPAMGRVSTLSIRFYGCTDPRIFCCSMNFFPLTVTYIGTVADLASAGVLPIARVPQGECSLHRALTSCERKPSWRLCDALVPLRLPPR
jgi:hypothetical protein